MKEKIHPVIYTQKLSESVLCNSLKYTGTFSIISITSLSTGIGYLPRNLKSLEKAEKSTSLTIFLLLFVLGLSIGSNNLIVDNLGKLGWQATVLATSSALSSILASFLVLRLFFKKEGES